MFRKPVLSLFIALIILGVSSYTVYTLIKVWDYTRLSHHAQVQNIQWSITSLSDNSFVLLADYSFRLKGGSYQGKTRWQEEYLNQWAAEEAVTRLEKTALSVWYDPSSPERSSLQKLFPLKSSLYTALLWALGIYFLGLAYYVNRRFS